MKPLGSVAAVIAAVREDAEAEVEAIERDATDAVARITAARPPAATDTAPAIAAARERARTRLSQEDWEDTRVALAERESWLADATALGRERLLTARTDSRSDDSRRDALARLAAEGIARLPAGPIVVVVTARDAALLDEGWRGQLGRGDPSTVAVETREIGGGCIVQSGDGRAVFDNSFDARIERLQSRWRSVLLDLYERVTAGAISGRAAR